MQAEDHLADPRRFYHIGNKRVCRYIWFFFSCA